MRCIVILLLLIFCSIANAEPMPNNLWQGLIAESTKGNLEEYRVIASIVRNRQVKGLSVGLIALKRKDLTVFVKRELQYNPKLEALTKEACNDNKDYANGATHYEHTRQYPVPKWAKGKKVVLVLYKGTKDELTAWK